MDSVGGTKTGGGLGDCLPVGPGRPGGAGGTCSFEQVPLRPSHGQWVSASAAKFKFKFTVAVILLDAVRVSEAGDSDFG